MHKFVTATPKLFPILLVLLEVVIYLSNDMYLPAVPELMQSFNIDTHTTQLTLTSWFLGGVSLSLFLGPISDYYGRRPIVLFGGVVYVVSTLVCAVTTNVDVLLIARFVEGATQGSVIVAGYAAIHELFETKRAIQILAFMGSIVILAPGLGPLAGSLVLLVGSWRTIFWLLALWGGVLVLLLYRYMPESNPHIRQQSLEMKKVLRSYLKIIQHPGFTLNTLMFCLFFSAFITWITAGPFVINNLGDSTVIFGVAQVLIFGCFMLGAQLVGTLMDRFGPNGLIYIGLSIVLFGGLLGWILTRDSTNLMGMIAGMMIFSFGGSLAFASLNRLAMEASPEPMGAKMAVFSTAMTGFGAIASSLVNIFAINNLSSLTSLNLILFILASFITVLKRKQ